MSKLLSDHTKHRKHTHTVTVEISLPAHSAQHAEMVVKNSIQSGFYDVEVINTVNSKA